MANGTITPGNVETDIVNTAAGAASGYLELVVDLNNMQAGDTVVFVVYRWLNGAWKWTDDETFSGAQGYKTFEVSGMYVSGTMRARVTIRQTAGVNRAFFWESEVAG